jgi:hypothetical protein
VDTDDKEFLSVAKGTASSVTIPKKTMLANKTYLMTVTVFSD